ncbi:MAG: hypothetical protein IJ588_08780 [Prevotella sp.]|nr:hypothetical protein [Prevotella sp.]
MAKEEEKIEQQQATVPAASPQATPAASPRALPAGSPAGEQRPNRDRYSSMFAEDNPDIDFEDKEARYGRMAEERESYRKLRDSGRKFSGILDKHRWLGAMLADGETNPLVWMANNGIDIRAALEDEETMKKVTEAFDNWTQRKAEGEAAEAAKDAAIAKSVETLDAVQQEFGLSDEQKDRMFTHFWDEVFLPAFAGEVSKDTWVALMHAMNYDQDMANAREEAAMQARNEKHNNRVKNFEESQVPPSFGQGSGGRVAPRQAKKDAHDDLTAFIRQNG